MKPNIYSTVRALFTSLVLFAVTLPGYSQAQPVPAGTVIESQANVSFFNERLGIYEVIPTNTVITIVNAVPALEVDEDQITYLTPDTIGSFSFFVANTGNTPISPTLSLAQQTGDDFDLAAVSIYVDGNGNGIVDPADTPVATGAQLNLLIGEQIGVIVEFQTPAALQDGDEGVFVLSASETNTSVAGSASGTVIVSTTGLALSKEVNLSLADPGDLLRYSLELRNRGSNDVPAYDTIAGDYILIDGARAAQGILVRDNIPLNTTFSSFSISGIFDPLYHIAGTDTHRYTTTPPADLGRVDAIAFFRAGNYPVSFSTDFEFELMIADNIANTFIPNIAETWQVVGVDMQQVDSNPVRTRVSGVPGVMDFTSSTGDIINQTGLDTNVRLRLNAAACNIDGSSIGTININIATSPEGDFETVTADETGPNTGVFTTTDIPVQRQTPVVQKNGVLTGDRATQASASTVCNGDTIRAELVINPGGFVFNSASNNPVAGADVILYNQQGSELQRSNTDLDGFYTFNETLDGVYRIGVIPPAGSDVVFPSQRFLFPGWNRNLHPDASYGIDFNVPAALQAPFFGIDIPLDPDTSSALILEKNVEPDVASPGELVAYSLILENRLDIAVANTTIYDLMPEGLTYIAGSARINGEPVDVTGQGDPLLQFNIGDLLRQETIELTYVASVDPLANGQLVNTAYADGQYYGDGLVRSNDARATLRVNRDSGVFTDRGVILGTVYVDFNTNGIQDEYLAPEALPPLENGKYVAPNLVPTMEPGIPGVKIYFENGAHVVTDLDGRYSIPGMTSRMHVAAISVETLPESVRLSSTTTRDALSPQSRFIRLRPGDVAGEYFATVPRDGVSQEEVMTELTERTEVLLERGGEIAPRDPNLVGTDVPSDIDFTTGNANNSNPALSTRTGILRQMPGMESTYTLPQENRQRLVDVARTRNLEVMIRGLSPSLDFMDLADNDTVNDDVVTIRVKGPTDGALQLIVNGQSVANDRISQRIAYGSGGVQAVEYVAVRLNAGRNTLALTMSDPFGNVRQTREITVNAPGSSTDIEIITPPLAYADPSLPIPVLVRITDAEGIPTGTSMDVTLESANGARWGARDLRPSEPGLQVFIEGGEAIINYFPPEFPGTHTIRIRNGLGVFEANIILEPNASERVIVGYVEGVVGIGEENIDTDNLVGYDETITGVNGALFLRGRIRGDAILTLRYDSDADSSDQLFRDVDPEKYYPVYGDASERGYEAQSNSQLYLRIDRGQNYVLYGDVTMAPQSSAIQLGGYSRVLTGVHGHYENGPVRVDVMAGRTDRSQVVREFRAEGVSGPYDLDLGDYQEGSETVEIITRDVRQPASIISVQILERYLDYRLDFFNDSIIFDAPVPATDEDGNLNFIRVSYESEEGGDNHWIYSGEVSYDVNERVSIGYREIRSTSDAVYDDRRTVRSGFLSAEIGEYAALEAEMAQSVNNLDERADASRVTYGYERNDLALRLSAGRTEEGFLEQGSSMAAGREELSAEAEWLLTPELRATTGVIFDRNLNDGAERVGAEALLERRLNDELTVNGGLRVLDVTPGDVGEAKSITSVVAGANWSPTFRPGLNLHGELEVDLSDASNYRGSLGVSDQTTERLRSFAELEVASEGAEFLDYSSISGMTATMKAGVEYRFSDTLLAFSNVQRGARTGISNGISGEWAMDEVSWGRWLPASENALVYARVEHFQPYDVPDMLGLTFGEPAENSEAQTSFAIGRLGEYNDGNGALRVDLEGTLYEGGYSAYSRQYWAQGYGDWTWSVENRLAYSNRDDTERVRGHLRFGGAFRDEGERLDMLTYAGLRLDENSDADIGNLTVYGLASGSFAMDADTRFTSRLAAQYSEQSVGGFDADSMLALGQVGFDRDFTVFEGFDAKVGGHVGAFYDFNSDEAISTAGMELSYIPARNVMLSVGHNWSDVSAPAVSDIYHTGTFLRFTMKLDNGLWDIFDRAGVTTPIGGN
jgi:uncharacterized repeat protein (TIGR01451 family)